MTPHRRPVLRWLLAPLTAAALVLGLTQPAAALAAQSGGDTNEATAVNTEDGGTVFRFALSVRRVADGVIDQTNTATAEASCTECRTVAVAFQVVLVSGDADVVVPENLAVAANSECAECFTYAAATQLVLGTDGMRLTAEGRRRLAALQQQMREVEDEADGMTETELLAAVQAAETELIAIFEEELVPIEDLGDANGAGPPTAPGSTSSTTSIVDDPDGSTTSTTSTTSGGDGTPTTTEAPTTTQAPTTTTAAA